MLDIIILVLQIIGIVLLGILLLLFAMIASVLFVPIKYKIEGKGAASFDSISADGEFSWFGRIVYGYLNYKNSQLIWYVRVGWFKMSNQTIKKKKKQRKRKLKQPKLDNEAKLDNTAKPDNEVKLDTTIKQDAQVKSATKTEKENGKQKKRKRSLKNRIKKIIVKLQYTKKEFCAKIKKGLVKKNEIVAFIDNDTHKRAFHWLRIETYELSRKCKPKKAEIDITYGFTDPYYTGLVLAICGFMLPLYGAFISVVPDFENSVFKGEAIVKGRLRIYLIAFYLMKVLREPNVKKTISDLRNLR